MNAIDVYANIHISVLSLQVSAILLLIMLPLAAVVGYAAGAMRRKKLLAADREIDMVVGETTLSAILALLGLLLAFSFGNALSLAQDRKSSITNEAAALGTAFLRADYLDEPASTELKEAIFAYAQTRLMPDNSSIKSIEDAAVFLSRTLEAQAKLWPLTLEATADPTPPPVKTFVASAINDALDAHLTRVQLLSNPVSDITQSMMLAAALVALFLLGNRAGLLGRKLTWRTFVFSGFLFVVMATIIDTQRGNEGLVRTDDTTMRVTLHDMEMALSGQSGQ